MFVLPDNGLKYTETCRGIMVKICNVHLFGVFEEMTDV